MRFNKYSFILLRDLLCYLILFLPSLFFAQINLQNVYVNNQGAYDKMLRPNGVNSSKDDHFVYVVGDNAINVFERKDSTGTLNIVQTLETLSPNGIPGVDIYTAWDLVFSPEEDFVYVSSTHRLLSFSRDKLTGKLEPLQSLGWQETGGCSGNGRMAISANGEHLYAVSNCGDDAIIIMERNKTTGLLSYRVCINIASKR